MITRIHTLVRDLIIATWLECMYPSDHKAIYNILHINQVQAHDEMLCNRTFWHPFY